MADDGHNFIWQGERQICTKCGRAPHEAMGYGYQMMPCRVSREVRIYMKPGEDAFDLFRSAPIGTKAPSIIGGHWTKTERGWKALGGDTFPTPGGDWDRSLVIPEFHQGAARDERV